MAKTMAEVLAEHPEPEVDGSYWYCPCGHDYGVTFGCAAVAAHQAAALSAAGYGLVAESPPRITQDLLNAQRAKGWTDWHPEDYCHRCYETNVSWYVDTRPWTDVMRGGNPDGWGLWQEIICIPCFTELADAHYGTPQAWTISRDRGSCHLSRADGLVADAKREALEEAAAQFHARLPDGTSNGRAYNSYRVAYMLRARAAGMRQG